MANRPVVIIHFQPLEWYPPVVNLLRLIAQEHKDRKVIVYTTRPPGDLFVTTGKNIIIRRLAPLSQKMGAMTRYAAYLSFYWRCSFSLLLLQPSSLLYFETLSSFPAWVYKKLSGRRSRLLIHYHEYTSPAEYASGMRLGRYFHKKEEALYPLADWISHTNADRMDRFLRDEGLPVNAVQKILPNYPPRQWLRAASHQPGRPLRIVYVGALSLDTMYAREFAQWVLDRKGEVVWHIYTSNSTEEAQSFFNELRDEHVRLFPPIPYERLPEVLDNYDVGIILYKGHILNYVYNAPNKLFEYLACGLDVWFPDVMKGCDRYITSGTYPRVSSVDFLHLDKLDLERMTDREGYRYQPPVFFYEEVLPELVDRLFK